MPLAKSTTIASACMLLCSLSAFAQPPRPVETDRPNQRWLPLPQGDAVDLSEQAQLLQQLRDLISKESGKEHGGSPLPKLSEQQLREMEKALESMRDVIGKDKLPNLESIPKEWIDQALSDPILRKQAQQLLEQYARDRKLPSPPDRTPRNSDGVPFPRRQPSDKPRDKPSDKVRENPSENGQSSPKPASNSKPSPTSNSKLPSESISGKNSKDPSANDTVIDDPFSDSGDSQSPKGQGLGGDKPDENSSEKGSEQPLSPNGPRGDKKSNAEELGQSQDSSIPARPDSESLKALQELLKKLKTIEGQRQAQKNDSGANPGSSNSKSPNQIQQNATRPNTNNSSRATKPNAANGQSNPTIPPRNSRSSPKPASSEPASSEPASSEPASSEPANSKPENSKPPNSKPSSSLSNESSNQLTRPSAEKPNGSADNDPQTAPPLLPPEFESSNSSKANTASPKSDKGVNSLKPSGQDLQRLQPGSRASDARRGNGLNSPDRNLNGGQGIPQNSNQSPTGSGNSPVTDLDIKTQLERHGLGRALQSIVEKTMKEQGEANSASSPATSKSANAPSKSKDNRAANRAMPPAAPSETPPNKSTASKPAAQNLPTTAASPNNPSPNPSSTMSGLRDMASQFWGAIRSAPSESSGGSSASSPNVTPSLPSFSGFGFAWSGRVWLLLGLILVMVAMLLLLARKRVVLATAAKEAEAELAKEILTEGIRTRADVVRAFHRFVLRRAKPVANWWTHRYAALQLTEASPQLRSVISDLASVYEHARYLPPEATLSSEDIYRVQAALKQCAASSG